MKLLLIGAENRVGCFKKSIVLPKEMEIDISDGDEEEDFDLYDIIVDLNCDDDDENMAIYAGLKDKLVIVSATKQSLAEMVYNCGTKVRSKLFGLNAIEKYLGSKVWEISAYRYNEFELLQPILDSFQIKFIKVADRVGMMRPRADFSHFNEIAFAIQEQILNIQDVDVLMEKMPLSTIDEIGITDVFENLLALYEDTKEERYKPCPLLKNKYLRDQKFIKNK